MDHRLIEILANAGAVDLRWIAELVALESPGLLERVALADLVDLSKRLPSGLIHAESIWILEQRPAGLAPLAEGSAWSAMDRSLVVEVSSAGDLFGLLLDLGRYHLAARAVRARLGGRDALVDALASGSLDPLGLAEIAVVLEAPPDDVARMEPAIAIDVAAMARSDFEPAIHVHDDARPDRQRERGARLAEELIARLPEGPFALLIADTTAPIELLSPYVRDLSHALSRWGIENPARIRTFGLVDALRAQKGSADPDLAALVVPDLMAVAPELLAERRSNEATQGLFLDDGRGTLVGYAELGRLDGPDRSVVAADASGTLVVAVARRSEIVEAILDRVLETRRVSGVANVGSADVRSDVVIARTMASDDDGFLLGGADTLIAKAAELGVAAHVTERLARPPDALLRISRRVRLARVRGELDDPNGGARPVLTVLYPRLPEGVSPTIRGRSAALVAARLVLAALLDPPPESGGDPKIPTSATKASVPRRFRA
jgi:hypothetical protein